MPYFFTDDQILAYLNRHAGGNLYHKDVLAQWALYDTYYKRQHVLRWPEVVLEGERTRNVNGLRRLEIRFNFGKTIVHSTETMVLSGGVKVYGRAQQRDSAVEQMFLRNKLHLKRLINYMSRYGAAWVHAVPRQAVPFRFYKPHDAVEITDPEDRDTVRAVLAVQTATEVSGAPGSVSGYAENQYEYARWYEWDTDGATVRVLYFRRGRPGGTVVLPANYTGGDWRLVGQELLPYMPLRLARNRIEDTLPEGSDLSEAIPILQAFDEMASKWNKAMEDEAFRQTFFAGVGEAQIRKMMEMGSHIFLFAKQEMGMPLPEMQVAQATDLTNYINGFVRLLKSLSTVTRTSPLELDERPVQDIPAQTLRVLMGPQLERCTDTAIAAADPLTLVVRAAQSALAEENSYRVVMEPQVPVAREAEVNNLVSQLQAKAISRREFLRLRGYTEGEIDRIAEEVLADLREEMELERDSRVAVEEAKAAAIAANRAPATTPTAGF